MTGCIKNAFQPTTTSPELVYRGDPNGGGLFIQGAAVFNPTGLDSNFSIYIIDTKEDPTQNKAIIQSKNIGAGETILIAEIINLVMPRGGALYFKSSIVKTCAISIAGMEL